MFENSKWIWADDNTTKDDRVIVRKTFNLDKPPRSAVVCVGASDSYNLWVNGNLVVLGGGLSRESCAGCGYFDQTDIARFLQKGANVIGFDLEYYGADANGHIDAGAAGLIVECAALNIYSDETFEAHRPEGYYSTGAPFPCGLYAGANVGFDGGRGGDLTGVFTPAYASTLFSPAKEYGDYGDAPFGELYLRAVPLGSVSRLQKGGKLSRVGDDAYECEIGAELFAPIIELSANGTEKVDIRTDRYVSQGGQGDESSNYNNRRIEYVCKSGAQTIMPSVLLSGTKLVITAPKTVKIGSVSYYVCESALADVGKYDAGEKDIDVLLGKADATLRLCMREGIWDTPDRGRGMDLAAFSAAARAAIAMYGDSALPFVKKGIMDFADFSGDAISDNAMGAFAKEVPYHSLTALSEWGAVRAYCDFCGGGELLEKTYHSLAQYLLLWQTDDDGLVRARDGDKRFYDGGYNIDGLIIENALYYSACKNLIALAFDAGVPEYAEQLQSRADGIAAAFGKFFDGNGYSSCGAYDDRANAFAVLAGLVPPESFSSVADVLTGVASATPQTEGYVIEALCALGRSDAAKVRMLGRYREIILSDNPTLCEGFGGKGALCFSGSAGIAAAIYYGFGGIKYSGGKSVLIAPHQIAQDVRMTVAAKNGGKVALRMMPGNLIADNAAPEVEVTVRTGSKSVKLTKGKNKI